MLPLHENILELQSILLASEAVELIMRLSSEDDSPRDRCLKLSRLAP